MHFEALKEGAFEATTVFYKTLGCQTLVIAMDRRAFTLAGAANVAQELSALAARLAPLGMRIGYHNHAGEMAGADGLDALGCDRGRYAEEVVLQQDVGWTRFAGKDPAALVRRYPGRTVTTHFKAKLPRRGAAGTPLIGRDRADWAGLVAAVRSAGGTEWIVVEQEEYPDGLGQLDAVAASLRGLRPFLAKAE
ncbi:MAG: hypothetical protein QM796_10980 [Chthoniobacteraceae bacterium]